MFPEVLCVINLGIPYAKNTWPDSDERECECQ